MDDNIVVASRRTVSSSDEDISDEQIEQLLARATSRLQEKSQDNQLTQSTTQHNFHFPRLDAGQLEKPYVSTKNDIATVDASRLLQEKHRKQANGPRKVEDPVISKITAAEVCLHSLHPTHHPTMRKIIPFSILSRVRAPFWLPFCATESFIYHSYSEFSPHHHACY